MLFLPGNFSLLSHFFSFFSLSSFSVSHPLSLSQLSSFSLGAHAESPSQIGAHAGSDFQIDVVARLVARLRWAWRPMWRSVQRPAFGGFGGVDMVAGFWVWWPAFGWLSCSGFAGFVVGTWWVLFCFVLFFYFYFFILGFWFRFQAFGSDLGGVWVVFGLALGGWIQVRWL